MRPVRGSWAERLRDAVLAEDRRRPWSGEKLIRVSRVLDDHRLEFEFAPDYLGREVVVLTIDGRRRFAPDFLVDEPDEQELVVEDWPIDEAAWRVFLLGMREPFDRSELVLDTQGRLSRPMTL